MSRQAIIRRAARQTDFEGPTGDEVIEAYTKGDGVKWARLAHRALELADTPSFRRRVRASLAGRRRKG